MKLTFDTASFKYKPSSSFNNLLLFNYWRWLKRKLIKEQNQLVSVTHGFKFIALDGKKRLADTLDSDGIISLAKHFPNTKAAKFLDWFTYSDTSIDGQSKKKAYSFFESNLIYETEIGTTRSLLKNALTDEIHSREMFMKGIDYSYHYEENE